MDLRHLTTFQAVLREGSFQAAAQALGIAQPTVTLHIQELEREWDVELFDRRGRRRERTPFGDLLAARGLPILDALGALERSMAELRAGQSGLLRVGSIEPVASRRVTPLLARLQLERPRLRIHFTVGGTGTVSRAVADGEIDVGLCSAPPVELGLRFEALYAEEMVLLLPRRHRLARRRRLAASDLAGEPLMITEQGCSYRGSVESALGERGVAAEWAFECGSSASLLAAVRHGVGAAFLPAAAVRPSPPGTVVRRLADLAIALPVGLVSRRDAPEPSPSLAAFTAGLRLALGSRRRREATAVEAPRAARR